MKKIALSLGLAAMALGFSACDETWDDNPVVKAPNKEYTDFLNEPELRETWITITKDDANKDAALHMTCSQPDFGFAAVANYVVEVCLTPDFAQPFVDGEAPQPGDYYSTESVFTDCSQINPLADEIAECVCKLKGWASDAEVAADEYSKIYVRLRAFIPQAEELTTIHSDPKSFEHIRVTYYAASVPGLKVGNSGLYIRGTFNDWLNGGLSADYEFLTTAKRGIYLLKNVTVPKDATFKFADAGWADYDLGASSCVIGTAFRLESKGSNIKCPEDFTGRILLINKGGVWRACMQKDGTFDPDKLDYTL